MFKHCRLAASLACAAVLCLAPHTDLRAQTQEAASAQSTVKLYEDAKKSLNEGRYEKALKKLEALLLVEPGYGPTYMMKGEALLGKFADNYEKLFYARGKHDPTSEAFIPVKQAVESFEQYLKLMPRALDADYWRQRIEFLRPYAELTEKSNLQRTVFLGDEIIQANRLRLIERPPPEYTERERQAQVRGTVLLLAIFGDDSTVKNIFIIRKLTDDLTENCIEATRKIKFTPALKDGRPVSQVLAVEYAFELY